MISEQHQLSCWIYAISKSELPISRVLVLVVLALHAHRDDQISEPSVWEISEETGLSEQSVRAALTQAKISGWIWFLPAADVAQNWQNCTYYLQWPSIEVKEAAIASMNAELRGSSDNFGGGVI